MRAPLTTPLLPTEMRARNQQAAQTQSQWNRRFSENDCQPFIGQWTLQTPPTCWCRPISRGLILTHFNSLGWVDRLTTQPNNQKPPKLPWIGFCRAQSLSLNDNTHARPQTHTEGLTTNQKTTDCRVRSEKLWYWSFYFTWDYLVTSFRKSGRFENLSSWKGPWEWANSPPPKESRTMPRN